MSTSDGRASGEIKIAAKACRDARRWLFRQCYEQIPTGPGFALCDLTLLQARIKQDGEATDKDPSRRPQLEADFRQIVGCMKGGVGTEIPACQTIEPCLRAQQAYVAHNDDAAREEVMVCFRHLAQVNEACGEAMSELDQAQQNEVEQRYEQRYRRADSLLH